MLSQLLPGLGVGDLFFVEAPEDLAVDVGSIQDLPWAAEAKAEGCSSWVGFLFLVLSESWSFFVFSNAAGRLKKLSAARLQRWKGFMVQGYDAYETVGSC